MPPERRVHRSIEWVQLRRSSMIREEAGDDIIYKVVVNHEEQYSIWPVNRENPLGWRDVGISGSKEACLTYIEKVWTDMRPLSLRKKMDDSASKTGVDHGC